MADNITILDSTGATKTVATDDVSSVHYQRAKSAWGADGSVADTSQSAPLPVQIAANASAEGADLSWQASVSNTAVTAKASAGVLHGLSVYNASNATVFIQVYDDAGTPTVGTTTPVIVLAVETVKFGHFTFPTPIKFSNTIKFAATTAPTNSTAPSAAVQVTAIYK